MSEPNAPEADYVSMDAAQSIALLHEMAEKVVEQNIRAVIVIMVQPHQPYDYLHLGTSSGITPESVASCCRAVAFNMLHGSPSFRALAVSGTPEET